MATKYKLGKEGWVLVTVGGKIGKLVYDESSEVYLVAATLMQLAGEYRRIRWIDKDGNLSHNKPEDQKCEK